MSSRPALSQSNSTPDAQDVSRQKFAAPLKYMDDFLNKTKKAPPPTPEQMDEAFAIYDECKATDMIERYYDCDCLSASYLEVRPLKPDEKISKLVTLVRKKCGNPVNVAGEAYSSCLNWAGQLKKEPESYCSCYANSYGKNFQKNPSDSIRGREVMMTMAMNSCNTGAEIAQSDATQRVIDYLKKTGLYKSYFPGSTEDAPTGRNQTPN